VGFLLGQLRNSVIEGGEMSCSRYVRFAAGAEDIRIGATEAWGSHLRGEAYIFSIPSDLASLPQRLKVYEPPRKGFDTSPASVTPAIFDDPGDHAKNVAWEVHELESGIERVTRNTLTGTDVIHELDVLGVERLRVQGDGSLVATHPSVSGNPATIDFAASAASTSFTAVRVRNAFLEALRLVARASGGGVGLSLEATDGTGGPRVQVKKADGTVIAYLAWSNTGILQVLNGSGTQIAAFDPSNNSLQLGTGAAKISQQTDGIYQISGDLLLSSLQTAITSVTYGDSRFPDQPTSIVESGVTTAYTYNADGTVHTEARGGKTRTFTYDSSGRVTATSVS
jgi:YD repeat-containing protein